MFWALFYFLSFLFFFKFLQVQLSRPRLWTSLIYNRFTFTKGFLDVGRPPLRFYEHLFSYCIWVYTFPALCMKFSLPRLEYRGEFWLHHQNIPSLSRLWMFFFFFTRCIYHPNLGTIILSSLIRPQQFLIQIMNCYAGSVLARPWFGRLQLISSRLEL